MTFRDSAAWVGDKIMLKSTATRATDVLHVWFLKRNRKLSATVVRVFSIGKLGREDLKIRRNVSKMRGIAGYHPDRPSAAGKGSVERIIDASTHDAPLGRFAQGGDVVVQGQSFNCDLIPQT